MAHTGASLFDALRGGVTFDRKRFGSEISRFEKPQPKTGEQAVPRSVDFFGDTRAVLPGSKQDGKAREKRKEAGGKDTRPAKKKKAKDEVEDEEEDDEEDEEGEEEVVDEEEEEAGGVRLFAESAVVADSEKKSKDKTGGQKKSALSQKEAARREEIAVFRKQMRITVAGDEVPAPVGSFDELYLSKEQKWLRNGIEQAGWTEPTPIQMQAIPALIEGRDILACAPTGSGKTGAFVIPLFARLGGPLKQGIRGLIVSPTRELATQIYRQCDLLRGHCKLQVKLLTKATAAAVANMQSDTGGKKHDVLVTTPARLVTLIQEGAIELSTVEMVIVDEADKLFEDGFVAQLDEILAACSHRKLQKALFSATIPPAVEQLAKSIMPNPVMVTVGSKVGASTQIKQKLVYVGSEEGKVLAIRQITLAGLKPPVLVFVQSIDRAKQLFRELVYDGINVDVMHAERTQAQRDAVITQFRTGGIWVLICTDLMARGIDFKGVNLVINYDFPQSVVSYIHRIGRTGRAGRTGEAITLFTAADVGFLRSIANVMTQSGCEVPDWMLNLKKANKRDRKRLAQRAPDRPSIVQVPAFERQQRAKKQQMIEQSKHNKRQRQASAKPSA
mmetsp:Transcript_7025/g.16343  ORF Transcript_7025/g.16343 Transcript_7025/m.16343 type:complete len:615 (+) Transcript_7025:82-1926(+)